MKNVLGRGLSSLVSAQPVPVRMPASSTSTVAAVKSEPSGVIVGADKFQSLPQTSKVLSVAEQLEDSNNKVFYIPVADIGAGQFQPRQEFSELEIKELSNSIQTHGVLQPILVRRSKEGGLKQYELIAGERRWRAAQMAGLLEIPALVKSLADQEALEIAIIENIQRNDLNPLEEAQAYQRLANEFSLTQEQVAQKVGKDRATVANLMRLLKLSDEVQDLLRKGDLSPGHAKALLTIKEPNAQLSLAKKTVAEALSVRSLEALVSRVVVLDTGTRSATGQISRPAMESAEVSPFPDVIEKLRNALATKVQIRHKKGGSGSIEIQYHSETELDRLVEALTT